MTFRQTTAILALVQINSKGTPEANTRPGNPVTLKAVWPLGYNTGQPLDDFDRGSLYFTLDEVS